MKANLQVEEGISNWLLTSIVLICAAPAVTLNVWPRIETILSSGWSSNQFGIVLLVTLSALGMTCVPFAMKKAENLGFWWTCLLFGIGLGILNYTMAVGAVGKSRDDEAGLKQLVIQKANSLRLTISEIESARRALPAFKWTTQEMVSTAAKAVDLALAARDQECGKVGDICRARILQLFNRQSELADIEASRAATSRAEYLDGSIRDRRGELLALGSIPESSDQQASRIASVIGGLFNLGENSADKVATGLIHFLAICAEAFALGMPRIIVTALARKPLEKPNVPEAKPLSNPPPSPVETPKIQGVQPKRNPTPSPAGPTEDIPIWRSSCLIRSAGNIRTWEAYSHYSNWAKERKTKPCPFPVFEEKLEFLGVKKHTDPNLKRDFYLEVTIKQPLKAVS